MQTLYANRELTNEPARLPAPGVTAPSTNRPRLLAHAQAAFYAFHQDALTFGRNRLTGRSQSLADKKGWLVNTRT